MITITVDGLPVSWRSHAGYGRRSFNPRFKEKEFYQWQIKSQWNREKPIGGSVNLEMDYHMPIPCGTSKVRKLQMLNNVLRHIKRPDLDNLDKFLSDCLIGIVMDDDSQVCQKTSRKLYSDHPRTVIKILPLN